MLTQDLDSFVRLNMVRYYSDRIIIGPDICKRDMLLVTCYYPRHKTKEYFLSYIQFSRLEARAKDKLRFAVKDTFN